MDSIDPGLFKNGVYSKCNVSTVMYNFRFIKLCLYVAAGLPLWCSIACDKKPSAAEQPEPEPVIDSLSFVVIGDWGMGGNETQKKIADQIFAKSKIHNAGFVVTAGDNFYPSGVSDVNDQNWKKSFEDIYVDDSLPLKWYPVLGNHDYQGNPQAEIEYSNVSTRWTMPGRYYFQKFQIDDEHSVLLVFTDTSPFLTEYYGSTRISPNLVGQDTSVQLKWLDSVLSQSNDTWKIVVGHHPVYSSGLHGNTHELTGAFDSILKNRKVDFYLAGHDHHIEHLRPGAGTLHYFISGGGADEYPVQATPASLFARSSPGFLIVTLYEEKFAFYFYNDNGELVYSFSQPA